MVKMEVVAIADAGDPAKQSPLPEESRFYIRDAGYPPQVGSVKPEGDEDGSGDEESGHPVSRVLVVLPVGSAEAIGP